ncbi:hypothetical protein LguiA_031633 [Lonicera macranthoides]
MDMGPIVRAHKLNGCFEMVSGHGTFLPQLAVKRRRRKPRGRGRCAGEEGGDGVMPVRWKKKEDERERVAEEDVVEVPEMVVREKE